MDYASKGVAGTGLGLGIAGTALGVLDYDMDGTLNQCELAARDEAKISIEGSK